MRWLLPAILACLCLGSCAKFPSNGGTTTTRIRFSMRVDGVINPNYVYVVAIRWSKSTVPLGTGPLPSVAPPWGNGIVTGRANLYVRWDPVQSPDYTIYRFLDPIPDDQEPQEGQTYLLNAVPIGTPIDYDEVEPGQDTITFELDMSQIATTPEEVDQIVAIQVNFLTMDIIPQGNANVTKRLDSIGDNRTPNGINEFISIPVTVSQRYDNNRGNHTGLEPNLDAPDPDLDIVDWSIEVDRP